MKLSRRAYTAFSAGVALAIVGCGDSGVKRHALSGSVTYQSAPVPSGTIMFQPDRGKGNSGPATVAVITGGRFETPRGKGAVKGPHTVLIQGYDGTPPTDMRPFGKPLFPDYKTEIDISSSRSDLELNVP
ncbi:MAG: hypothetical protein AAF589_02560 [Planctomycetota bacterium]